MTKLILLSATLGLLLGACGAPSPGLQGPGAPADPVVEPLPGDEQEPVELITLPEVHPVKINRAFMCRPNAIRGITPVADVDGLEGASIGIAPNGPFCTYDLVFQDPEGRVSPLSGETDPSGYLLAVGGRAPNGSTMVCASNIRHTLDPDAPARDDGTHPCVMGTVQVECALNAGEGFARLSPVIVPDGPWAAWVLALEAADSGKRSYRVIWMRDYSFQFLNMANEGRPREDGIYATYISFNKAGDMVVGDTELVSEDVFPKDAFEHEPWEPTAEELEEMGDYVVVDEGECPAPHGCPVP